MPTRATGVVSFISESATANPAPTSSARKPTPVTARQEANPAARIGATVISAT